MDENEAPVEQTPVAEPHTPENVTLVEVSLSLDSPYATPVPGLAEIQSVLTDHLDLMVCPVCGLAACGHNLGYVTREQ